MDTSRRTSIHGARNGFGFFAWDDSDDDSDFSGQPSIDEPGVLGSELDGHEVLPPSIRNAIYLRERDADECSNCSPSDDEEFQDPECPATPALATHSNLNEPPALVAAPRRLGLHRFCSAPVRLQRSSTASQDSSIALLPVSPSNMRRPPMHEIALSLVAPSNVSQSPAPIGVPRRLGVDRFQSVPVQRSKISAADSREKEITALLAARGDVHDPLVRSCMSRRLGEHSAFSATAPKSLTLAAASQEEAAFISLRAQSSAVAPHRPGAGQSLSTPRSRTPPGTTSQADEVALSAATLSDMGRPPVPVGPPQASGAGVVQTSPQSCMPSMGGLPESQGPQSHDLPCNPPKIFARNVPPAVTARNARVIASFMKAESP